MTDLCFLGATAALSMMQARTLSAREYVEAHLVAIELRNPAVGAFLDVFASEAMAVAGIVDDRRARGEPVPPLAGLPVAVKDLVDVAGHPTTAQSAMPAVPAPRDAEVVARIRRAGGILLGKLALEEWGIGSPLDDGPAPPARNPWDVARTAGGSSSGSAVALAAGLVPLAIGTDTGGSVRNPAALCGVVGLKPTRGRISRSGVAGLSWTMDHVGPMARTVGDCSLLFGALAKGPGGTLRLPDTGLPLAGRRVAHLAHIYEHDSPADDAVRSAVDGACRTFERLGATIVPVQLPGFARYREAARTVLLAEAFRHHRLQIDHAPHLYGRRCLEELMAGATIDRQAYAGARAMAGALSAEVDRLLSVCDVIVTAVVTGPACRLDDEAALTLSANGGYRVVFNLSGHPALSLCAGYSSGLPVGIQLIGRKHEDEGLLAVGEAFQAATDWHLRRPGSCQTPCR